ncbi:hypothetical protein N2152v2_009753 [Parachlorella kessleri]
MAASFQGVIVGARQPLRLPRRSARMMAVLPRAQALVLKFETIAGRGAMIGLIVAATFELLVPHKGLFGGWQSMPKISEELAWLTIVLLALSIGLATVSGRRSQKLLEPVITSLTSTSRSVGSVAKQNVDSAVDYVVESLFTSQMLRKNFPLDD